MTLIVPSRRELLSALGCVTVPQKLYAATTKQISLLDYIPASEHNAVRQHRSNRDVTGEIQRAIDESAAEQTLLHVPAGTYRLSAHTVLDHADPGFCCMAALVMRSFLQLQAAPGAVFKMAAGLSASNHPQPMVMFGSDKVLEMVSFFNLTMDMNGIENLISDRKANGAYSRLPQAHVFVSGGRGKGAARIDDCEIAHCRFTGSPGVSCIVAGQSNSPDAVQGRHWRIRDSIFYDNGHDTDDHSSIFGQSDDMLIINNSFDNPRVYNGTGGNTAHEVHGIGHVFTHNRVRNYLRGVWVSSSNSTPGLKTRITSNTFETLFYGVDFFRDNAALKPVSRTTVSDNVFVFDDAVLTGLNLKVGVQVASSYTQSRISITSNSIEKTGSAVASCFAVLTGGQNGPGVHDDIVISDNAGQGLTFGIFARTSKVAGLGDLRFSNNRWSSLAPAGIFTIAAGCMLERTYSTQSIRSLKMGGGSVSGAKTQVPALFINTTVHSLELKPMAAGTTSSKVTLGGAGYVEGRSGSLDTTLS